MKVTLLSDVVLAELEGEVDQGEVARLTALIGHCLEGARSKIILSFKDAQHINYQLPMQLQPQVDDLQRRAGAVKLAHVSDYHQRIFDAMGLGDQFEQYHSVEQALLSLCDTWSAH